MPTLGGMKTHDESNWRDVQFQPQQWANIPQSAGLWGKAPPDQEAELRNRTAEELALLLHAVLVTALTPRQRQVMELYYLEDRTQVEIATSLGISQATVSQHLTGKSRGLTRVGGAFRKIRKTIHKAAKRRKQPDARYTQLIRTLDQLLDGSITHRRARTLLDTLAKADSQRAARRV